MLTPVVCGFAKSKGLGYLGLAVREMEAVKTNDVLQSAGIQNNGTADLVLTTGENEDRPFLVFELKKDIFEIKRSDITLAHKHSAVYMQALLMKQLLSKVSNIPILFFKCLPQILYLILLLILSMIRLH